MKGVDAGQKQPWSVHVKCMHVGALGLSSAHQLMSMPAWTSPMQKTPENSPKMSTVSLETSRTCTQTSALSWHYRSTENISHASSIFSHDSPSTRRILVPKVRRVPVGLWPWG